MKKLDIFLVIGVLVLAGVLYFSGILRPQGTGAEVVITVDRKEFKRIPLDAEETIVVETGKHRNVVVVKDGYANVTEADCPDLLCVNQKKIHLTGETIVCLPHKMVVEIVGGQDNEIDATVQ